MKEFDNIQWWFAICSSLLQLIHLHITKFLYRYTTKEIAWISLYIFYNFPPASSWPVSVQVYRKSFGNILYFNVFNAFITNLVLIYHHCITFVMRHKTVYYCLDMYKGLQIICIKITAYTVCRRVANGC